MAKTIPKERRIIIYPDVSFDQAKRALDAYIEATGFDNNHKFTEKASAMTNWQEAYGSVIQIQDCPHKYVMVYVTPIQYVIKPIDIKHPVIIV